MSPAWLKLLRQHQRDGRFALTFSFLLGASRNPVGNIVAEDVSLRELTALLTSMRDCDRAERVRILRCIRLWQPVAALGSQQSVDERPMPSRVASEPKCYVWNQFLEGGVESVESLAERLWQLFRVPVNEGLFSYDPDDESFKPFSPDELAFISRALANERE